MNNLISLIQNGATLKLEISGTDLLLFSNDLINRAKSELHTPTKTITTEQLLTKTEVKEMCGGICDATLWHWHKKNYLRAIKIGHKVRYRLSDIQKILSQNDAK